jgi:hypothetical protein
LNLALGDVQIVIYHNFACCFVWVRNLAFNPKGTSLIREFEKNAQRRILDLTEYKIRWTGHVEHELNARTSFFGKHEGWRQFGRSRLRYRIILK